MSETSERRALILAIVTMATWGAAGSFVRLLAVKLAAATPFVALAVLGVRLAASLIILAVLVAIFQTNALKSEIIPALRRGNTWIGGTFQFVYYLLAVIAFILAPISEIALCASTAPIWVLFIRLLQRKPVTRGELLGAIVALLGVCIIVLPNVIHPGGTSAGGKFPLRSVGLCLSLTSALVTAIYAQFQRRLSLAGSPIEPRALSLVAFLLGVPLLVFLRPVPLHILEETSTLGLFAALALVSTVLPTLAFAFASRRLAPVTSATVALLLPVFATAYAAMALHEMPAWTLFPGGVCVVVGLILILRSP